MIPDTITDGIVGVVSLVIVAIIVRNAGKSRKRNAPVASSFPFKIICAIWCLFSLPTIISNIRHSFEMGIVRDTHSLIAGALNLILTFAWIYLVVDLGRGIFTKTRRERTVGPSLPRRYDLWILSFAILAMCGLAILYLKRHISSGSGNASFYKVVRDNRQAPVDARGDEHIDSKVKLWFPDISRQIGKESPKATIELLLPFVRETYRPEPLDQKARELFDRAHCPEAATVGELDWASARDGAARLLVKDPEAVTKLIANPTPEALYVRARLLDMKLATTGNANADSIKAKQLYQQSADADGVDALVHVTLKELRATYRKGTFFSAQLQLHFKEILTQAADRGSKEAIIALSGLAISENEKSWNKLATQDEMTYDDAIPVVETAHAEVCRASRLGFSHGQYLCAFIRGSTGTPEVDGDRGLNLLKLASDQGHSAAALVLAERALYGTGEKKDIAKAFKLVCAALSGGLSRASYVLSRKPLLSYWDGTESHEP